MNSGKKICRFKLDVVEADSGKYLSVVFVYFDSSLSCFFFLPPVRSLLLIVIKNVVHVFLREKRNEVYGTLEVGNTYRITINIDDDDDDDGFRWLWKCRIVRNNLHVRSRLISFQK